MKKLITVLFLLMCFLLTGCRLWEENPNWYIGHNRHGVPPDTGGRLIAGNFPRLFVPPRTLKAIFSRSF